MKSNPRICLCYFSPARHHKDALDVFKKGLNAHGIKPMASDCMSGVPDCDLAVFWSHKPKHIIQAQKVKKADYLVMERGYIGDRKEWTSIGFNGLNGNADFALNGNMPGDRWDKHFGDSWLKPWKRDGDYTLLCGQVQGDASVNHISISLWASAMASRLQKYFPDAPVRYRPHPIDVKRRAIQPINGTPVSTRPLEQDLKRAKLCVTFNSNTGVDALLAGVPVLAYDKGSMAFDMATHEANETPVYPDRTQWAYDMSYCQWTWPEIANGEAWEHLKRRYEPCNA